MYHWSVHFRDAYYPAGHEVSDDENNAIVCKLFCKVKAFSNSPTYHLFHINNRQAITGNKIREIIPPTH